MKIRKRILASAIAVTLLAFSMPASEIMAGEGQPKSAAAGEEAPLKTMEQVADISSETPVEDQIVIVYDEPSKDNVKQLGIAEDTVLEGESITDQVDVLTPEESVNTD